MLSLERKNFILSELQTNKKVIVSELGKELGVSEETIRRDLEKICKDGSAVKIYGGAIINDSTNIELPFNVRKKRNVEEKQKIAAIIDSLIDENENIILDPSTSAVFVAKVLKNTKKNLTVLTNSIETMIELSNTTHWNVISPGGSLKEGFLALSGPNTIAAFGMYNADKLVFSCKGIDIEKGVTDGSDMFSQTKQAMIKSAKTKILAVDHSKFDRISFSKITELTALDIVVTDRKPEAKWLSCFRQNGIECIYPTNE